MGPEKGVITKGVFSLEESLESLKSLNSRESLESGWIRLCFPQSGDSLESLDSLGFSLESLANRLWGFSKGGLVRGTNLNNWGGCSDGLQ